MTMTKKAKPDRPGGREVTAAKKDISDLPGWPRALSLHQAAAYVGLSPNTFNTQVIAGVYPKAVTFGRRKVWDRKALDQALDKMSGLGAELDNKNEAINRAREFLNGQRSSNTSLRS